jgi:TonB family protein
VVTGGEGPRHIVLALLLVACVSPSTMAQNDPVVYDDEMKIIHFEDVEYPASVREAGIQGTVVVRGTLSSEGAVTDVAAVSGPRALLPAALANAKTWRYAPNRQKRVVIIYQYRLVDRCATDTVPSLSRWYPPNTAVITGCRKESSR